MARFHITEKGEAELCIISQKECQSIIHVDANSLEEAETLIDEELSREDE